MNKIYAKYESYNSLEESVSREHKVKWENRNKVQNTLEPHHERAQKIQPNSRDLITNTLQAD